MITVPVFIRQLAKQFQANGHQFYIVGGAVRDALAGHPVKEWDATTDAKPAEIEKLIRQFGLTQIGLIGQRFGTVTGQYQKQPIEITTFRSEEYRPDSRQPTVKFGESLLDDLSRRDFTINAIAYDPIKETIIDPHDGQADLGQKTIRAVGRASERFEEDPLRMLRAIRFAVTLGFTIDEATLAAISQEKERLPILSAERVADEMGKMLLAAKPSDAVRYLVETGLIAYTLPELLPTIDIEETREHKDIYAHILQVLDNTPPKLELRWCALLHDIAKPLTRQKINGEIHFLHHENVGAKIARQVLRRLHYSNEFTDYVTNLVRFHQRLPNYNNDWNDGAIRRFVREVGECLDDLFTFADADSTGANLRKIEQYQQTRAVLRQRIVELEKEAEIAKIKSPLSGEELMAIFHRPAGPWIKPIKEQLLALVLDGQLAPEDRDQATKLAKQMIRPEDSPKGLAKPSRPPKLGSNG